MDPFKQKAMDYLNAIEVDQSDAYDLSILGFKRRFIQSNSMGTMGFRTKLYQIGRKSPIIATIAEYHPTQMTIFGRYSIGSWKLYEGAYYAKLPNCIILGQLKEGWLIVYRDNKWIGSINLENNQIFSQDGQMIGYTDRNKMDFTRYGGPGYSIFLNNRKACLLILSVGMVKGIIAQIKLLFQQKSLCRFSEIASNLTIDEKTLILALCINEELLGQRPHFICPG